MISRADSNLVISERVSGVLTSLIPKRDGGCILLVGECPEGSLYLLKQEPARYEMEMLVAIHRQMWNARKGWQ